MIKEALDIYVVKFSNLNLVTDGELVMIAVAHQSVKSVICGWILCDDLVICTDWNQFKAPDFELIANELSEKTIFDGRNLYDPEQLNEKGFNYYAIGRGDRLVR